MTVVEKENHLTVQQLEQKRVDEMQIDLDIVKAILMEVTDFDPSIRQPVKLDGYDALIVARHVQLLFEAGLLDGVKHASTASVVPTILVQDMSWDGHRFAAGLRDKDIWAKVKEQLPADKVAVMTMTAVARDVGAIGWDVVRKILEAN